MNKSASEGTKRSSKFGIVKDEFQSYWSNFFLIILKQR